MPFVVYKLGKYLDCPYNMNTVNKLPWPHGAYQIFALALVKVVILAVKTNAAIQKAYPWYDIALTVFSGINFSAMMSVFLFILFGICTADFQEEGFKVDLK